MSITTKVRESQKVTEEYLTATDGLQDIEVIFIGIVILVILYIKMRYFKK